MNDFLRAILAGLLIALGGAIYLTLGGVIGAIAFAFGLLMVVHYKTPLYTGIAGFIDLKDIKDYTFMMYALIGNIIGCYLLSLLQINVDGTSLINARMNAGYLHCLLSGIGCGFIMTLIVNAGRNKNNMLAILFGVPLFILLGFYHSIADTFYFFVSSVSIDNN